MHHSNNIPQDAIKYVCDFVQYTDSQTNILVSSLCNSISFFNQGSKAIIINDNLTLQPGQNFSIAGNMLEIDTTQYKIVWASTGSNGKVMVLRKSYVDSPIMKQEFFKALMAYRTPGK